jgi:predicted transcriptional regulator
VQLNDPQTLNEFINLKKAKAVDWWDEISTEERLEIEEGLDQADKEEVVPHEVVMAKYQKWL